MDWRKVPHRKFAFRSQSARAATLIQLAREKKKEIAFSRDRNRLRVVNDCVAVREGERDIVDIEYRTLQLRGCPC